MEKKLEFLESHGLNISALKDAFKYLNKHSILLEEKIVYSAYLIDKAFSQLKLEKRDKLDRYFCQIDDCREFEILKEYLNTPYSRIVTKPQGKFQIITNRGCIEMNMAEILDKSLSTLEKNIDRIIEAVEIFEVKEQLLTLDIPGSFRDRVLECESTKELGSFNYRLDKQLSLIESCMYTLQRRLKTGNYIDYTINDLSIMFKAVMDIEYQLNIEVKTDFEKEWDTLRDLYITWSSRERNIEKFTNLADLLLTIRAISDKLNKLEIYWVENYRDKEENTGE